MIQKYLKSPEIITSTILYSIIFIGVTLAIFQFIFNRSLWLDEAYLALNIINKDFLELLTPLDHSQVSPIGFLFVEKLSTLVFGKNEFSLRLFPLLGFLFSIPFMYLLTKALTKNKIIALMSTSFFSITIMLIRYSSEVKQYSIDVLVVIILLYLSVTLQLQKHKSLFIFAIVGSIVIWFSNVSIIVLTVVGIYILITECWHKKNYKVLFPFMLWLLSFSFYYYYFIYDHPTAAAMKTWWINDFLPLNPFSFEFYHFLGRVTREIFVRLLGISHHYWFLAFFISFSSIAFLFIEKNYKVIFLLLSPILLHLLLSGFELYPFKGRLILYITPLIIILYSIGLYSIFKFLNKKTLIPELPVWLLTLPVLSILYTTYLRFPVKVSEIKHSIEFMRKNIQKSETVYIYHFSSYAFNFYQDTNITNITNKIKIGESHVNHYDKYDHELLSLKGKVWLLFSHRSHRYGNEEKYMIDLLLNNNSKLLDVKIYHDSSLYYIDRNFDNEDNISNLNSISIPDAKSSKAMNIYKEDMKIISRRNK